MKFFKKIKILFFEALLDSVLFLFLFNKMIIQRIFPIKINSFKNTSQWHSKKIYEKKNLKLINLFSKLEIKIITFILKKYTSSNSKVYKYEMF